MTIYELASNMYLNGINTTMKPFKSPDVTAVWNSTVILLLTVYFLLPNVALTIKLQYIRV